MRSPAWDHRDQRGAREPDRRHPPSSDLEEVTDLNLGWDLRTYFSWRGVFFARAYQIHARDLSANNLDDLNTASGIEADRTRGSRSFDEHHFGDRLRIRIGQQSAGQEFIASTNAKLFVNSTFGWPRLPGIDLPSGGPNYPGATPANRFRVDTSDAFTFFAGIFNENPTVALPGTPDSQRFDLSGTSFRINDGMFAVCEGRHNPHNSSKNGSYRRGAWYNSEKFPSQNMASNGLPAGERLIERHATASRQRLQHLRDLRPTDQSGEGGEG